MNEDRGTRYQRMRRRGTLAAAAWSVFLMAALVVTDVSLRLRDLAERAAAALSLPAAATPVAAAASFALLLVLIHEAGVLPVAYTGQYTLDRRYGLTDQRPASWLLDHLKALALRLILAVAAAVVVVACLRAWPEAWWVPAWAVAVAALVGAAWAMPVWLLPRFYRFSPLDREALVGRLAELAVKAGVPAVGVYTWYVADRTRRVNAMMTGLGANRRILVSDTLLTDYSDDEIEVILAHELAHHVRHDVWKGLAASAAVAGLALWCAHLTLARVAGPLGFRGPSDLAGLPVLILAAGVVSFAVAPVVNVLSRRLERKADRFALEATGKPEAFSSAIKRLSARNLADEEPPFWARVFFYTHPPAGERLELARRWMRRS